MSNFWGPFFFTFSGSKKYFKFFLSLKKQASKVAHTLLFHSPAQITAHSPELIFHIMKSRDQTSVLLSVLQVLEFNNSIFHKMHPKRILCFCIPTKEQDGRSYFDPKGRWIKSALKSVILSKKVLHIYKIKAFSYDQVKKLGKGTKR